MKAIDLTKGKVAVVDNCVFEWLSRWKWYAEPIGDRWYAARKVERDGRQEKVYMHRQIAGVGKFDIDHVDGDGLHNRMANLRISSRSQNMAAASNNYRGKTSRYRGVHKPAKSRKWVAKIRKDMRQIQIGYFECEHEAARAYNERALELYGDFARLNIVENANANP